jgi:hypothetical protein
MTEIAALKSFFDSIVTTYPNDNVPDDAQYPYLTFEPVIGFWEQGAVPVQCQLWHRTESDAAVNKIVRDIAHAIGYGGASVACDGGWLWIKTGSPFAQTIVEHDDDTIKRRLINISVEFMTNY